MISCCTYNYAVFYLAELFLGLYNKNLLVYVVILDCFLK